MKKRILTGLQPTGVITLGNYIGALKNFKDYQDEYEMDNDDIKDGYIMSYVVNHDCPDLSEFGSIAVKSVGGGLVRIG